jgi:anti-sigma28 factor (negative regulator of flagellin synthesis)
MMTNVLVGGSMNQSLLKGLRTSFVAEDSDVNMDSTVKVDRVQDIKNRIANGTYELDMSKVAPKLVENLI